MTLIWWRKIPCTLIEEYLLGPIDVVRVVKDWHNAEDAVVSIMEQSEENLTLEDECHLRVVDGFLNRADTIVVRVPLERSTLDARELWIALRDRVGNDSIPRIGDVTVGEGDEVAGAPIVVNLVNFPSGILARPKGKSMHVRSLHTHKRRQRR